MAAPKFVDQFAAARDTVLDNRYVKRLLQALDARFSALEDAQASVADAADELLAAGLDRINDILVPAADRIQRIASLGFLTATSTTPQLLEADETLVFVIPEGDQRDLFTPSPWVFIGRASTPDDYAVAQLSGYDATHGELTVVITDVVGDPGPHSDWAISGLGGSTIAAIDAMHTVQAAIADVAADAAAIAATTVGAAATAAANAAVGAIQTTIEAEITALAASTATADALAAQKAQNLNDLANKATAFANIKQAATTSASGVVALADLATTQAGTDQAKAVTPYGVIQAIAAMIGVTIQAYSVAPSFPVGIVSAFAGFTPPAGWLLCYGQAINRTTYSALFAVLRKSATVTITIANPGVVTWTAHGLRVGDPFIPRSTGALPTGLTAGTVYYVSSVPTANTFQLSATRGGASLATTGTQSGVHTGIYAPHGDGDGATTFNVPDRRGRVSVGKDDMGGTSANRLTGTPAGSFDGDILGNTGGEEAHATTTAEMPPHVHSFSRNTNIAATGSTTVLTGSGAAVDSSSTGGGAGHNNIQPGLVDNVIIYAGV